jgi:hypothetical protein
VKGFKWLWVLLVVVLSWDPNTEADLAGYNSVTTFTHNPGGSLYFVTAFNTAGLESAHSNAVLVGSLTIY